MCCPCSEFRTDRLAVDVDRKAGWHFGNAWVIIPPETSISSPFLPTYQPPPILQPTLRCSAASPTSKELSIVNRSIDTAPPNQSTLIDTTRYKSHSCTQLQFQSLSFRNPFLRQKNPGRSTVMAMFSSKRSSNSNNYHHPAMINRSVSPKSASPSTAPVLASCYATSSSSTVVQGFHYSSTGTNG
jgi:hypothetical protein